MATKVQMPLTVEQREAALRTLVDQGLTFSEVMTVLGPRQSEDARALIHYAAETVAREGEIEIDLGRSVASMDDDDNRQGYVLAWVWVERPEGK